MKGKDIDQLPPKKVLAMVSGYFEERFGLSPDVFSGHSLYLSSKGRVYLGPKSAIDKPKIVTLGLLAARVGNSVKPTTNILQLFGRKVTKSIIELTREQTISFARGEDLALRPEQADSCPAGYVLLRHAGYPLGCGQLQGRFIKTMLPKAKRLEIKIL
ncbi:MAG: hypothetical protein U0R44_01005 [Candidatus Micrarchaeia archaeon]